MSNLHLTSLDFAIVAIVAFSTLVAVVRGFVRETLSIFAWAAAVFVTFYFGHGATALLTPYLSPLFAKLAGYIGLFLVVLIPLSVIGYQIAQRVQNSGVGALDRSLGGAFGIARGLAIVAMAYILVSLAVPLKAQPAWINQARLLPLVQSSASVLMSLIPSEEANYLQRHRQAADGAKAVDAILQPGFTKLQDSGKSAQKSYGAQHRSALDTHMTATGGKGGT